VRAAPHLRARGARLRELAADRLSPRGEARTDLRLRALRATAVQLAAGGHPDEVLSAITRRLVEASPGSSCLISVQGGLGAPSTVHATGLSREGATQVAADLDAGRAPDPGTVVVPVRAGQRSYGRLVLLDAPSADTAMRDLLATYAGHAAASLSRHDAVEQARLSRGRAGVLAALSRSLAGTQDAHEVAHLLTESLPATLGCDSAAAWLWDAERGEIRAVAATGLPDEVLELLLGQVVRPSETPELAELLARREPLFLQAGEVTPTLEALMGSVGVSTAIGVPLTGGDNLFGVATASWTEPLSGPGLTEALTRLQGVADRASTALENAHLVHEVRHQSQHDPLTGLPNRVLFQDRLDEALRGAGRDDGVAVLFCDLDRFKQINDSLGHAAGDEVLRQVASRLSAAVRPGDTVGRLSGDEFAALLPGLVDTAIAREVAGRLVECFDEPLRVAGRQLQVTASVGVSIHLGPYGVSEDLLGSADAAMYSAKRLGRNQIALAASGPSATGPGTAPIGQLRDAIEAGEMRLVLQPVVRFPTGPDDTTSDRGEVIGGEALVRWEHPQLGMLTPGAFVPRAEEDGSIVDLDLWVLRQACTEAASWPGSSGRERHIAVNLSVRTLSHPGLAEQVRSTLLDTGLPPHLLHLEVVESRAMLDLPHVVERLVAMRHLGVRIALDDFGTGFSTLTWLLNLPVDMIKIDRSFVVACGQSTDLRQRVTANALLRGFVAVGAELDVAVLAEGVETAEQLAAVRTLGCSLVQGYLLGRPMSPDGLRALLEV